MNRPEKQDIERLTGVVNRIRFHSAETGFSVISLLPKGRKDTVIVCGSAAYLKEGEYLECTRNWRNDPKFGMQFKAENIQIAAPDTAEGMEKYLSSGIVKGIGCHFAKQLVNAFGNSVFDVIDNEPHRMLELPGIGPKRVEAVKEAWKEQRSVRDIMVFLQTHGVGAGRAVKIYKMYGESSIVTIKQNPYVLSRDVSGIGFKIADSIAMSVGIPKDSVTRARAGVRHILSEGVSQGHCYLLGDDLIEQSMTLLEAPLSIVDKAILEEVESGGLAVEGGERFFLPHILKAEKSVARHIKRLASGQIPWRGINSETALIQAEKKFGITLSKSQTEAVKVFCKSKATVVTGGPGVGKTATLRTILSLLLDSDLNLVLCAPTGKAAKRMYESTGVEAKTIHRTLEYDGESREFKHNAKNPLKCDLVVIDESSMIDILVM
jgi:exodeoxyribonuclease V alpha subunit